MMYRMTEEDQKKMDEIREWLIVDMERGLVFRDDTPEYIRKERERISKKYDWLD